jgi:DNA recombination protein RmuC
MPVDSTALLAALPWLAALGLLALVALLLWRQLGRVRGQLDEARAAHGVLQTESITAQERLLAAQAEISRVAAELARRETEFKSLLQPLTANLEEARRRNSELQQANGALTAQLVRVGELTTELGAERRQHAELQQRHARLSAEFATVETRALEKERAANEKIAVLEQAETRLTREFENLANRIFDDKQQKFSESSRAGVEALLNPVREQLGEFRKKVEDIYDSENRDRASLRTEIGQLKHLNERISGDALNLTRALKGDAKVRGNWGEIQLERLLEDSGLVRGREYEIQASFKSEDGQRFQPDVVVHLPERKDVIIDSKVSLVAYEQYHATDDDTLRAQHVAQHIGSLRAHINGLAAKKYDELIGVNSLDLVILFVPIEPALLLALEHQPALYEEAYRKGILLVSPSTLMGTLQIIHNIWRYEHQNRNRQAIADQAGGLYDAFVTFADGLEVVGKALGRAKDEFEKAQRRLTTGRGNIVRRVEKLKVLGVKVKNPMPAALLDAADDDMEDAETLPAPTEPQ